MGSIGRRTWYPKDGPPSGGSLSSRFDGTSCFDVMFSGQHYRIICRNLVREVVLAVGASAQDKFILAFILALLDETE